MEEKHEQIKSGSNDLHTGETIRTFMGHFVNVFDPDPDTIDINDIAHALANTCRFGGHTYKFFSVAEHCCMVATNLKIPKELKITALLHDATEAYMCDMPRPIKRNLPGYKEVEKNFEKVIAKKFNLVYPFPAIIKEVDNDQLEWEHQNIILQKSYSPHSPKVAEWTFVNLLDLWRFQK